MGVKITSVPIKVSYVFIWTPKSIEGSVPKYSVTCMYDKKNKEQMTDLKNLVKVLEDIKNQKWPTMIAGKPNPKAPRIPVIGKDGSFIKDADQATDRNGVPLAEKNPEYAGHYIFNLYSVDPLQFIVDRQKQPISDKRVIYAGCICRIRADFYAYEHPTGGKGVTGTLIGIQKWEDGEALGGFVPDDMDSAFPEEGGEMFSTEEDIPF